MDTLKGKRLLFLGATSLVRHVIEKAHEMGVYVIVTDYIKDAPAKALADEAYDVSTLDVDALEALAKKCRADGVMTGYADINLQPCAALAARLGMPFYATPEQIENTLNKNKFKALSRSVGLPVTEDVPQDILVSAPEKIPFPIIIKPADSYSSRGISVCHTPEEVKKAIPKAKQFASKGEIVAERFMTGDDIYLYFTVQKGTVYLSAMADRLLNAEQYGCAPQPVGYFHPSKYAPLFLEEYMPAVRRLVEKLGLQNGSFFLQGFHIDGKLLFFELGLRLSGGAGYQLIAHESGYDQVKMHIRYALTGEFGDRDIAPLADPLFKRPHCVMVVLLKNGTIAKIEHLDEVLADPHIIDIVQFKKVGDTMTQAGTLNQVFARIFFYADTYDELLAVCDKIKGTLSIVNTENESMILNFFSDSETEALRH